MMVPVIMTLTQPSNVIIAVNILKNIMTVTATVPLRQTVPATVAERLKLMNVVNAMVMAHPMSVGMAM